MKEEINDEIHLSTILQDDSEPFYYAQHCHEGMLAFAYALDKTIRGKLSILAYYVFEPANNVKNEF